MTDLVEFLLARIAEDRHLATDAAAASGEHWTADVLTGTQAPGVAEHVAHQDPARIIAESTAKRRLVMACREMGADTGFLGARPEGLPDFYLSPRNQHQLAALALALLALPYADHPEYEEHWRP